MNTAEILKTDVAAMLKTETGRRVSKWSGAIGAGLMTAVAVNQVTLAQVERRIEEQETITRDLPAIRKSASNTEKAVDDLRQDIRDERREQGAQYRLILEELRAIRQEVR